MEGSFQWSQPLTIYHCGHGYVASLCSVSIVGRKALRLFEERLLESHFLCHLYFKIQLSQTHFDPAISISKFQIEISFSYLIFHLNLIFCIFANTLLVREQEVVNLALSTGNVTSNRIDQLFSCIFLHREEPTVVQLRCVQLFVCLFLICFYQT